MVKNSLYYVYSEFFIGDYKMKTEEIILAELKMLELSILGYKNEIVLDNDDDDDEDGNSTYWKEHNLDLAISNIKYAREYIEESIDS